MGRFFLAFLGESDLLCVVLIRDLKGENENGNGGISQGGDVTEEELIGVEGCCVYVDDGD